MGVFAMTVRRVVQASHGQVLLLTNSGALVVSGVAAAALGFMFWWFAARYFPPHAVGLAAAAISIMNLIGLIGEFGLGTLLMGESLRRAREAPGLISAALFVALASSTLFGIAFLAFAELFPTRFGNVLGSAGPQLDFLFIAGCAITGFAVALDCALVSLLRSALQMYRCVSFSVLKLALLPALAFAMPATSQVVAIFLAWVLGKLLSILLLVTLLAFRRHAVWSAPNFEMLGRHAPSVLGHHMLNLVTQGPRLILPFLVTIVLSAEVNAAFFAAWMIFGVVLLAPASLTTVLFTMGSVQPAAIAARMRLSLWLCVLTSVVAGAGFLLVSDPMLGFFGPSYASIGGPVLQILALSVLANALKFHYIAVQRLNGRMVRAAVLLGAGGVVELALAIWGAQLGGLSGFAWGWVCAVYLEAACTMPTVLRAARSDRSPELHIAAPHRVPPSAIDQSHHSQPRHMARAWRANPSILRRRG